MPDNVPRPIRKPAPGNIFSRAYQPSSGLSMASCANSVFPFRTSCMALLPKMLTIRKSHSTGAVMAAMTNSRSVRPREMRARNRPTNGPQASQKAQKNRVQPAIHSEPPSS